MNARHVLAAGLIAVAAAVPSYFAIAGDSKGPPIKSQMGVLKDGMKKLSADLEDPKKMDANLEAILKMQEAVHGAKQQAPQAAAKQEKDAKEGFVKEYRQSMIELEKALLDVENAILAGDAAKAKEALQTAGGLKEPGHQKFNPRR